MTRAVGGALAASAVSHAAEAATLPTIKLGKFEVTRLVAGYNPIGGYSHSVPKLSALMREWFTAERTLEYVRRCEANGINTWQMSIDQVLPCNSRSLGYRFQNAVDVPHARR